jgi:hypothetical protein
MSEKPRHRAHVSLESLEGRLLLSTFLVVDLGDAGAGAGQAGDLRYCIDTANANTDLSNRIVFQPGLTGTIRLTQGELAVTKSLRIDGPGADQLTVSGGHQSGVFNVTAPAGQSVILGGLTIADGTGSPWFGGYTHGGGVNVDATAVTLNDCVLEDNSVTPSGFGSGIAGGTTSTLVLNDCTIADNTGLGGLASFGRLSVKHSTFEDNSDWAILNDGNLTLADSTIADNYNGGIQSNGPLTVTTSRIEGNQGYAGVGILNHDEATIVDSVITHNTGIGGGGGVFNSGHMTVTGSAIANNSVQGYGGGIDTAGDLVLENTTISGNHSDWTGGGIYFGDNGFGPGILQITSSTVTDNSVGVGPFDEIGGGGLRVQGARVLLRNTIIAGNRSGTIGPDVRGPLMSLGYNLVGDPSDSTGWGFHDLAGTPGSALDPHLGPLQDNGGATPTHALLAGSPALGAGDPTLRFTSDQRGSGRTRDAIQTEVDIGAFNVGNATQFFLAAPATAGPGQPITVTLTALDRWGNRASTYTGTVHFSSTDLNAVLPDDTPLSAENGGSAIFTVAFNTLGEQLLRAGDADRPSLLGDASVLVGQDSSALTGLAAAFTGSGKRKHEPRDWFISS